MFKFKSLFVKNMLSTAAVTFAFSCGVYATELIDVDNGGVVTIQCITGGNGQKICCSGDPGNMTCEVTKV